MAAPIVLGITIRADGSAQVRGELDRVRSGLDGAGNSAQAANRSFAAMARETLGLGSALKGLAAGLSAVALYQATKDTVMLADKMTLLDSRIKIATKSVSDYKAASDALTKISLATGSSLELNIVMFGRLNKSVESAGGSYRTTLGLIKTLNEGLKISGASAAESSSVVIQLSQALSSGVLRGDEFNSVMENGSRIIDALTTATGKTKGELRKMAEQGQLTTELVIGALQAQAAAIHNDFSKIPLAIGAALENITTSFSRYIQSINEASGSTGSMAQMLNSLSMHLVPIIDGIVTLGKIAVTVFAGQMAISIGAYAAAKYTAITMEYAHAAALTMDIERTVALTAAQLAATSATVASIQATLASTTAMGARMAITNQLNIALFAQVEAQAAAAAAMAAQTAANTAAGLSFAALLNPINLVNIGLSGLVGWEIGGFLNKFEAVRRVANDVLYSIVTAIESVTYYWNRLTAVMSGNSGKLDGLKAAHLAQNEVISDLISSDNAYVLGSNAATKSTEQQATATKGLTGAQGTATDATKKAADEAQKKAEAIVKGIADEIDALNDQHLKLILSERDYYATTLAAKGMSFAQSAMALAIWDSNKALEAQKASGDKAKALLDDLDDKYRQLTLSAREYFIEKTKIDNPGIAPEQVVAATAKFDRNAGVEASQKSIDSARTAVEAYNSALDQTHDKFGKLSDVSSAVFDASSGGIDKVTGAFTNMLKALEENTGAIERLHKAKIANDALERATSNKSAADIKKNNGQYLVDLQTIHKFKSTYALKEKLLEGETLKSALSGVRQTASATAQMFEEGTAARKAFSIVSLAASVAERLQDIASLSIKAAIAVAEQGKGDPYTAFARMAAMASIVASVIAAAGAGTFNFAGGGKSPGPQGLSPDTGTVLGDSTAKSESIDKTYQLLQDIQADNYPVLKSIDQGIANLQSGITDVITRLFQAGGLAPVTAPKSKMTGIAGAFGSVLHANPIAFDPILEWLLGSMFGGKKTSTVTAQGISTGATSISDIMAGGNLSARQFAQIETKTKGGWFGKDKFSTSTQYAELDSATQKALNNVFKSMGDTMLGLADNLLSSFGPGLADRAKNYIIPALSVDLKGLSGEDAAKKLGGVISAQLDTMSTAVFGDILGQYQQLGEGMLETAVRIVAQVAVVQDALSKSGLSIAGNAIAISDALVQAAGGLKEFQKSFDNYYQKFYTDAEKQADLHSLLTAQLGNVNLSLAANREGYRKQLEALDLTNAADQQRYSVLLKLSEGADQYYTALVDGAKAAADAAKAAEKALADAAKSARDAALSTASTATGAAMSVLQKAVATEKTKLTDTYNASIKTTQTAIDGLNTSVQSLSTLAAKLKGIVDKTAIPGNEASDRTYAQSVLSSALILYKSGGGLGDQNALSNALDVVAKPSENLFRTFSDYQVDFALTAGTINDLSDAANSTVSKVTSQLDVLKSQLELTKTAYTSETARLDGILDTAKLQLDAANGTTVAVLSVRDALLAFSGSFSTTGKVGGAVQALADRKDPITSMYQNLLGRAPDAAGAAGWNAQMQAGVPLPTIAAGFTGSQEFAANAGSNPVSSVTSLYESLLGRAPDPTGLIGWGAQMAGGASVADIAAGIMGSQEYAAIKAVRGYASGGDHSGGWRIVGENGPELENTGPSRIFSNPQSKSLIDNSELIAEMRVLNATVDQLKAEVKLLRDSSERGNENTQRTADTLNGRQGVPFLVEIAS